MKKISIPKIKRRSTPDKPVRITNETVAEHRERIIAGGRRFKYPLQYARHRLVINAVIITTLSLILLVGLGWWQLYFAQNTSTFFYRVTQVLPLPVGSIDGSDVRYSDYLLYYRPSEYYLNKYDEIKPDSQDGKLQLEYKKRDAMDRAIADAYARKIAREQDITVSDDEVTDALAALKKADNGTLSDDAITSSAQQVFGITQQDIRTQYHNSILRGKVAFAVDDTAAGIVSNIERQVTVKQSLKDIADSINKDAPNTVQYGVSGLISQSTVFDGVNVADIASAEKDTITGPIKSMTSDGYLFFKVLATSDNQVNFEFVHVPLKKFANALQALKDQSKLREYIKIDPDQYTN